jgi:sporulation protein YlmC with PRC-barrel domain
MRENIMLAKYAIAGLAGSALLASVAFAQSPSTPSDTTKNSPVTTMSDTSTPSSFQGNWRASKLVGLSVYNEKNESLGSINDMLTDKNGKITAVVIGVGGFLGVGEHYVAVSPASVSVRHDAKNDKWLASMNTTKEALKAAPEFKYPK